MRKSFKKREITNKKALTWTVGAHIVCDSCIEMTQKAVKEASESVSSTSPCTRKYTQACQNYWYIYYFLIYLIIKVCWFIQNDIWYTILQVCILCRLLLKWRVNVNEISARTRISLRDTLPTSINMPLRCCVFTIRNLTALQITSLCTAIRLLARANTLTTYAVNLVEERRCICKINT